jgi:hypothetical protein
MQTAPTELINDPVIAWEVAHAQKPFMEIALVARSVGQLGIASSVEFMGEREVVRMEEIANADKYHDQRRKEILLEEQAFLKLCHESDEDILTPTDFKIANPRQGLQAWERLLQISQEYTDLPVRFMEYRPDNFVLIGNVAQAAKVIQDPEIAGILHESAIALEAGKQSGISGVN